LSQLKTIPAYNERRFIGKVVLEAREFVDEVVVVDDGSTHDAAQAAEAAGAVLIDHGSNRDYGKSGDALVVQDSMVRHNPDEITVCTAPGPHVRFKK